MCMSRRDMIAFIKERLEDASDQDVESVYWMVALEIGD